MTFIRKRKLTQNQTRRIAKNSASHPNDDCFFVGVIVAHFGRQLDVQLTQLPNLAKFNDVCMQDGIFLSVGQIVRCHARTNLPMLTTNDGVLFSYDEVSGLGCIEKVLARNNLLARPDRYHKLKPVAANVDILAIVFAPLPVPAVNLLDRYLLLACINDIQPLLVLNKRDLLTDGSLSDDECQYVKTICQQYQSLGFDTVAISSMYDKNLNDLQVLIQDKMSLFVGQSGVGKSSIVNALLPKALQNTNVISSASKLGQHTTTTSRLLSYCDDDLSAGIIDTPGIREYGIWHLSKNDVPIGFPDLMPYLDLCQFRDCTHRQDSKGCALWRAVDDGHVLARRVDSLVALQAEACG